MNNIKKFFNSFLPYLLLVSLGIIVAKYGFGYLSSRLISNKLRELSIKKNQCLVESKKKIALPTENLRLSEIPTPKPNLDSETTRQTWVLNGFYLSDNKGYALINNQILGEGDRIGEATVEKITSSGVELKLNGKTFKLTIK